MVARSYPALIETRDMQVCPRCGEENSDRARFFLLVSRAEMRSLVRDTGWRVRRFIDAPDEPLYVAILEKE